MYHRLVPFTNTTQNKLMFCHLKTRCPVNQTTVYVMGME